MMGWKKISVSWEKTDHPWDGFGVSSESLAVDQNLDAKLITIWRSQELGEVVENIIDAASSAAEYIDDPEVAAGFALAIAAVNLFPLHLKIIWQDEHAAEFLRLLHEDEVGVQYFLRSELSDNLQLDWLIDYFLEHGVLSKLGDRFIVNGRVLTRAHIQSD